MLNAFGLLTYVLSWFYAFYLAYETVAKWPDSIADGDFVAALLVMAYLLFVGWRYNKRRKQQLMDKQSDTV